MDMAGVPQANTLWNVLMSYLGVDFLASFHGHQNVESVYPREWASCEVSVNVDVHEVEVVIMRIARMLKRGVVGGYLYKPA